MDRSYRNRLLREAVRDPAQIAKREKFWKLELWPYYLRRCDDVLFEDPFAGLALTRPAPALAARIAAANPGANGADLMILGYSYLGGAYRRVDDYSRAEDLYRQARKYRHSASPQALAEHLRRLAYLHMFQGRPECFAAIDEAIAIHKRGSLVHRHELGECLLCRGHAYHEFGQPGKSLEDLSAALNHVSLKVAPKPYHAALHILVDWTASYGTEEELRVAYDYLKPALAILNTVWGRPFPKLKMRWLIAVVEARLGHYGRAEEVFLEVRKGLVKLKLGYEVGMVSIDLAFLYLAQGRQTELRRLARETAALFRRIGVEAKAREALDVWRRAEAVDEDLLKNVREIFFSHADPMPKVAA